MTHMNYLTATHTKINSMNTITELNQIRATINTPGLWDDKDREYLNSIISERKEKVLGNVTLESEFDRRWKCVNDEKFREMCAEVCRENGITEQEWNENKAVILMRFANQGCRIQNELI